VSKGFDCATPLTKNTADLFYSQGFKFVCRYLAPVGSWKRLTAGEAKIISEAGLYVVSVFERGATNAIMGAAQGLQDGALALQYAREVGQPEGSVIYAAVDTDINASHYDAIEAYMRAFDSQIPGYELGAYGEFEACKVLKDRGAVNKVWQTYAWSKGAKMSEPNLYQFENDVQVNGIGIDRDESDGDAGGWKTDMAIKNGAPSIDPAAVNFIIDVLKSYYAEMEGQPGIQAYTHDCTNALRRSAGLPEE
jgi:hypothetical protein